MFKDRRQWIGEQLLEKPFISLSELSLKYPEVSEMTLRRDIEYFEKRGEAIKVRGGARSTRFITEEKDNPFSQRMNENIRSKMAIGKCAASFFESGRSIFLDSGSTVQKSVAYIPNERFVFTTTAPQTALELCRLGQVTVNLCGGRLDRDYQSLSGIQALRFLQDINIDIAVMCPSGFSLDSGFTGGNINECELKKAVVKKARKTIMLLDISKLDRSLPYTFATLEDVDILICDKELPEDVTREAKNSNTEIIIAK